MKDAEHMIRTMCVAYGQPVRQTAELPKETERTLRKLLLMEEFDEYLDAEKNDDIVEVADALADMCVIILGTAAAYGIPLAAVFEEVHRSNMAKVMPDGTVKRRGDGKILKPDGWTPPDIAAVLRARG